MNNNDLKIELLRKIYDLEMKGVKTQKRLTIEEPIETLIFEHSLLQQKYDKLCENNHYKTLSHFLDMVKNMSNDPTKNIPYTDEQLKEDLHKLVSEKGFKVKI